MNKCLFLGFIFLMNFIGGGCTLYHSYPKIEGEVFDSHSGKPIKNAAVVGIYNIKQTTRYGEAVECVHAMEAQTNSQGQFLFKDKFIFAPKLSYSGFCEDPLFYIFSPGYEVFTGDSPLSHFDYMKTNLGNNAYRIKARPIMSLIRKGKSKVYSFRLSPLKTLKKRRQNLCFADLDVDPSLIPYYETLVNNETKAYGRNNW